MVERYGRDEFQGIDPISTSWFCHVSVWIWLGIFIQVRLRRTTIGFIDGFRNNSGLLMGTFFELGWDIPSNTLYFQHGIPLGEFFWGIWTW